jgi:class 3 adenylate cyclase
MQPETRYARLGQERVAYQVMGEGPPDLVLTPGSFSNIDGDWEDPESSLRYERVATFCRLIRFDRRGTGASDPLPLQALPPWESYVEELICVMDTVGSERAAIFAAFDAGPMGMLFAATKPERTTALILGNTSARFLADQDYPIGYPREVAEEMIDGLGETWGTEEQAWLTAPSRAGDERFRRWYAKYTRSVASPGAVQAFFRATLDSDARHILPSIHVPTLIMHRTSFVLLPIAHGRYLAQHIEGAKFVEIPGSDGALMWEQGDLVVDHVQEFLTGVRRAAELDRVLATVLFTDIVASTERVKDMGDRRWRQLLDLHDEIARRRIDEFRGRLVKTIGDGILATFDGPGRGIRSALALRNDLKDIGLTIRVGVHTGEIELRTDDVGGLAVHIGARVLAAAGPGEILVSRTVRDLVFGSDVLLEDRGVHALKGVEGDWQLFAVAQ